MAYREDRIDVHGATVQYLHGGSGAPLLYLHSAGGEIAWLPFFDLLARQFTIYVPASPGFAGSTGLERIDTIEDLVFHTVDVLDALGLEQPSVVGLSFGGWLAAELAVHHPHRVRRLVLVSAVGLRVDGAPVADLFAASPTAARGLVFRDPDSPLARQFIPDQPSPEQLEAALKAGEATARVGWNPFLHDPKLRDRLYRVKAPTRVIWGDSDRLVPIAHGKAYRDSIAGADLKIVPGCGHAPPFELPEETARLVLDFLQT
jgi:pimeloyl-ACP methyl ester carboxylesterase